jgi:hypothetical protein
LTDSGFRFLLDLQPNYRVKGEDVLGIDDRPPGQYIITYSATDGFELSRAIPPAITIENIEVVSARELSTYESVLLRVRLHNDSNTDIDQVNITLNVAQGENEQQLSPVIRSDLNIALNADSTMERDFIWTPSTAGEWRVSGEAQILSAEGEVLQTFPFEQSLTVNPPAPVDTSLLITAFGLVPTWVVVLLWAALAVAFIASFLLILRHREEP